MVKLYVTTRKQVGFALNVVLPINSIISSVEIAERNARGDW